MAGQIDGIGDDGGCRIGLRRRSCQHGNGVGDAERETAAMAPAGRDAPRRIVGIDDHRPHQAMPVRPVHQADGELLAVGQMQRDVAAIIDISTIERRRAQHGAENLFGDGAGHRRHRRDEMIGGKRRDRRMHAARDHAFQRATRRSGRLAQFDQFLAEFVEQAGETPRRCFIGGAHIRLAAFRFDDQVDRTVLQMQPLAVGKKRDLRQPFHARRPGM